MAEFDPSQHPHRRFNPLLNEHVLVSPHRARRPWQGQVEPPQPASLPTYDASCYLCPGNSRVGGLSNPDYSATFVFENDFAALLPPPSPEAPQTLHPLLATEPVHGRCDVVVFHPRHDLTLAHLEVDSILLIVQEWTRLFKERSQEVGIKYVQIFENKGAMMGCSNPHPHSQVWSLSCVPSIPERELSSLARYSLSPIADSGAPRGYQDRPCLLCEYAHFEAHAETEPRVVVKTDDWLAVVPWWAVWPYELLVLPFKRHIPSLAHLTSQEALGLAQILSAVTIRYDNIFSCSFAYSMGIHQTPCVATQAEGDSDRMETDLAHLHLHFSPPLLRSSSVRKFLVGFEIMSEPQRDLTPEEAANRLRGCSAIHYAQFNSTTEQAEV